MVEELHLERRGLGKPPISNDPSLPSTAPKNSFGGDTSGTEDFEPPKKKFIEHFYNREKREYCGRTLISWVCIISYGFIYLIFLTTITLVLLYLSLFILKEIVDFKNMEPVPLTYREAVVGLTATPTSENSYPLIWYKYGDHQDYAKYVKAIEKLLFHDQKYGNLDSLGPCGRAPFGYGDKPCIIIRINKYFNWIGKPLTSNSTLTKLASPQVKEWINKKGNLLWLECKGYHSYDREHIGSIKYYPDPPAFDPKFFPLHDNRSPLVAIQISNFTIGISLAIECNLWYESGPASIVFVLYVAGDDSLAYIERHSVNV